MRARRLQESNPGALDRARALRREASKAVQLLWRRLRGRQLGGAKFRREEPIGPYCADFFCPARRLVIEVDGDSHYTPGGIKHDLRRAEYLRDYGVNVRRFTNAEVLSEIETVLQSILDELRPSP